MKRAAFFLVGVAAIGLAGCSSWGRNLPRPPQRSHDEQVEARQEADAKTKECVIRQAMRRQQIERGRDVSRTPKEKC
jgi:hypothetical protein